MECEFDHKVFAAQPDLFTKRAIELFQYQYKYNSLYREYVDLLRIDPESVQSPEQIPFLPISFFKTHKVVAGSWEPETWFESSGTTGSVNSRHFVRNMNTYRQSFRKGFSLFYGNPEEWCIVGLLPAYLERQHSSLVVMVDELIRTSKHPGSGFYLYNHDELAALLQKNEAAGQKTWLIGVTFALLDFAEAFPMELKNTVVLETGGMKGRREELTRTEVQAYLKQQFQLPQIHAEYGMTELFSQAYSKGEGRFLTPPWMRVMLREEDDPQKLKTIPGGTGVISVIDLANVDSCAFIATEDLGRLHNDGSFEILGRLDNSDLRGCSLLVVN